MSQASKLPPKNNGEERKRACASSKCQGKVTWQTYVKGLLIAPAL